MREIANLGITAPMPTVGDAIRVLNVLQQVITVFQEDAPVLWTVVLQRICLGSEDANANALERKHVEEIRRVGIYARIDDKINLGRIPNYELQVKIRWIRKEDYPDCLYSMFILLYYIHYIPKSHNSLCFIRKWPILKTPSSFFLA